MKSGIKYNKNGIKIMKERMRKKKIWKKNDKKIKTWSNVCFPSKSNIEWQFINDVEFLSFSKLKKIKNCVCVFALILKNYQIKEKFKWKRN